MKKAKFKVGDEVVICKSGRDMPRLCSGFVPDMDNQLGSRARVRDVIWNGACEVYEYRLEGVAYYWDERLLKKAEKSVIVVYVDGKEVVALNKATGKKGVARCNPSDEFDFDTGAKIAFCRLYGKEPELVKKMKEKGRNTFKALCLRAEIPTGSLDLRIKKKSVQPFFCAGKVYEVKDGRITDEEGYAWGGGSIDSIEDLNSRFCLGYNACFVKVGEDWE